MIVDTHSHVYDEKFDEDIDDAILRAKKSGVGYILLPNVDLDSISRVNNLVDKYPDFCLPMMGLHPTCVTSDWEKDLEVLKDQFALRKYIAVGEIGLDLYWDKSFEEQQKAAFEEQLKWSIEYDLPVSIHCRDAVMESIECVKNVGAEKLRGVFHSFGGSKDELMEVLTLKNFLIGINGTLTYKNSSLPEIVHHADLGRLVVETDAPYLPPVPYRGKRNEPSYTIHIINKLSDIYGLSPVEIENITTDNAMKMFSVESYLN